MNILVAKISQLLKKQRFETFAPIASHVNENKKSINSKIQNYKKKKKTTYIDVNLLNGFRQKEKHLLRTVAHADS